MLPEVEYARLLIVLVRGRAEQARREGRNEIGASAVEWAIISGIVVLLAIGIGKVITDVVNDRSGEIGQGGG